MQSQQSLRNLRQKIQDLTVAMAEAMPTETGASDVSSCCNEEKEQHGKPVENPSNSDSDAETASTYSENEAANEEQLASEQMAAEAQRQEVAKRKQEHEELKQKLTQTAEAAERENAHMQQEMKHSAQCTDNLKKVGIDILCVFITASYGCRSLRPRSMHSK